VEATLVNYRNHPDVLAVEPNYFAQAVELPASPTFVAAAGESLAGTPDDPQYPNQWALPKIGAPVVWPVTTGSSNVVIVVIDSGVNYHHEDLRDNLWRNPGEIPGNGIDDDGNGFVDDVYGIDTAGGSDSDPFDRGLNGYYHGSAVAGIIGAVGNNRLGVAGVNWSVRIMALRAIRASNLITVADELRALDYVLEMKARGVNIRAVNMSYGGMPYSVAEREALGALGEAGILVCAAAGNNGANLDSYPFYPASHPLRNIIAVAASDRSDQLAVFPDGSRSNYGRTNVDLAAPGVGIASTFGPATNSYQPAFAGTSAAAPFVAGAVGLLAAFNPEATAEQIKTALLESVDVAPDLVNRMVSQGRVNLARAMDHPLIASGPPVFARQPESATILVSNRVSFSALVFGGKPRAFQWLLNDAPVNGATNTELVLTHVTFENGGDYVLAVSNSVAVTTSRVARLTVVPLSITAQPRSQSVRAGGAATFSVSATSPAPLAYQWRFNGTALAGATNATLRLSNVQIAREGVYSVSISNRLGGVESAPAVLTVLVSPAITVPPLSQTVVRGGSATLSAAFSGHPLPFGVEWRHGFVTLSSNTVAGVQDFFTITNVQTTDAGTWRVTVRNLASATGVERSFTLTVLADSDRDGLPDVWELAHGFSTNNPADALLDIDNDGLNNRDEYQADTNPTNAASSLRIQSIEWTNGAPVLTFLAASNKTYTVQALADGSHGLWRRVADVVAVNSNRVVRITDSEAPPVSPSRIYRVANPRQP
jgi:hypothetical protein